MRTKREHSAIRSITATVEAWKQRVQLEDILIAEDVT